LLLSHKSPWFFSKKSFLAGDKDLISCLLLPALAGFDLPGQARLGLVHAQRINAVFAAQRDGFKRCGSLGNARNEGQSRRKDSGGQPKQSACQISAHNEFGG
jgi:hypothetical protein